LVRGEHNLSKLRGGKPFSTISARIVPAFCVTETTNTLKYKSPQIAIVTYVIFNLPLL